MNMAGVAQLVRASGCGPEGRGFEPHHSPQVAYCGDRKVFFWYSRFMSTETGGREDEHGIGWKADDSESLPRTEALEDLEAYPHFADSVRHFMSEFDEYLTQLRQETIDEMPEEYDVASMGDRCKEVDAANPSVAIALFLKRRGAPIGITDTDGIVTVAAAPEINEAYAELWDLAFDNNARRLANDIARGMIHRLEAFPELANPSIMEVPSGNRHMLWAFKQGILQRAYVTSTIAKYLTHGADMQTLGSVHIDAPLAEGLIAENGVLPLPLESILGMSEAVVAATLQEHPDLVARLGLDLSSLPEVDASQLEVGKGWFEVYWRPVHEKLEAEKAWRAEQEAAIDQSPDLPA